MKMVIFPALEQCPGAATEKLCRDYLALSDDEATEARPRTVRAGWEGAPGGQSQDRDGARTDEASSVSRSRSGDSRLPFAFEGSVGPRSAGKGRSIRTSLSNRAVEPHPIEM